LPVGETGGASGAAGFAGTRLQDGHGPSEAGRKPIRSAPRAKP